MKIKTIHEWMAAMKHKAERSGWTLAALEQHWLRHHWFSLNNFSGYACF
jgi:hypothetical protein